MWDHEIFYFIFCACTNVNKEFQTKSIINHQHDQSLNLYRNQVETVR